MKLALLGFLIFLIAKMPPLEGNININVAPKKPERSTPRRDTTPHVEMSLFVRPSPKRLTYVWTEKGVTIQNVEWKNAFPNANERKFYARINKVDEDGNVKQTLFGSDISCDLMSIRIVDYGLYKIAVFPHGAYCNGIEFDFRYFGHDDITPIQKFSSHSILCQ